MIMAEHLVKATPNMLATQVESLMDSYNIHHIPVLDDDGKILGIISMSDILQLQNNFTLFKKDQCEDENRRFLSTLLAEEIMTENPITLNVDNTIEHAVEIFLDNQFRAIPILRNGHCVGMITPYDILRAIKKEDASVS